MTEGGNALVLLSWFEHSVEQVTGLSLMESSDASWGTTRASVVEEGVPGRTASSVTTSGFAATNVYSVVPVTRTRPLLSREDLGDVSWT